VIVVLLIVELVEMDIVEMEFVVREKVAIIVLAIVELVAQDIAEMELFSNLTVMRYMKSVMMETRLMEMVVLRFVKLKDVI
tara:strand:+ start:207 stop:449 length:243 start_codon:yes stop_codon:yes gene_type:complete